jgi:hypothetical protein
VGYNREKSQIGKQFFLLYVFHNAGHFTSVVSYTTTESYAVYCIPENLQHCIPQRRRFSFVVSHNGKYFPPLWDTTEEVFFVVGYKGRGFFHCGIQWKRFFSILGYNGRGFFPLWDTMKKNYTTQNDIFKF